MEIGKRATAPEMQKALAPDNANSLRYGEGWAAYDLVPTRVVDTMYSLLVIRPACAPAHTCLPRVAAPEQRHAVRFSRGQAP